MLKDLLYVEEHTSCVHYVSDHRCTFKYLECKKGEVSRIKDDKFNCMIFIIEGETKISCGNYKNRLFKGGNIILLPKRSKSEINIIEDSNILIFTFDTPYNICDKFHIKSYWNLCRNIEYDFDPVKILPPMKNFIDTTLYYLKNNINCEHFFEIKNKEIFLVLRWFYPREDLALLLYPIIGQFLDFRAIVLENHSKIENVSDLVALTGMSRTNFDSTFKDEFGMPAHKWMLKQLAKRVLHNMTEPGATVGKVTKKLGFNSATHFTRFCKQQFGCTPTELLNNINGKFDVK